MNFYLRMCGLMSEADDDLIKRHDELEINKICSFILQKKKGLRGTATESVLALQVR